ncbi:MAG TPA: AAC(3) family N-acetyltransferase [Streptosporangiaceae bacterium]|nr:AAC(3) family N-acetyltransferase [Streptosporangiaceae bacterium]
MLSRADLARDFEAIGVNAGQVLLVHCSMRRIGWIDGGADTVVNAVRDVLGDDGTVVVPTETADNSDTSRTHQHRTTGLTGPEVDQYRGQMLPFDPAVTPSTGMGRVAEVVRTTTGALRSVHPQSSFAALGPKAAQVVANHRFDCHLGESSPLARLYDLDAKILLLGVGYDVCTAFHLAEYRYRPDPPLRTYRCVVAINGAPRWAEYEDVVLEDKDFASIGAELETFGTYARGAVGNADSRLISLVQAVDLATAWFRATRS